MAFIHDEQAGEWQFTCTACKQTIYAPTKYDLQYQYGRHKLIKPIEARLCPSLY